MFTTLLTVSGFHLFSWGQQVSGNMLSTENRSSPDSAPMFFVSFWSLCGVEPRHYREKKGPWSRGGSWVFCLPSVLYPSSHPFIHLSIYLSVHPSFHSYIVYSSIHPSIHPPPPTHPSIYLGSFNLLFVTTPTNWRDFHYFSFKCYFLGLDL